MVRNTLLPPGCGYSTHNVSLLTLSLRVRNFEMGDKYKKAWASNSDGNTGKVVSNQPSKSQNSHEMAKQGGGGGAYINR